MLLTRILKPLSRRVVFGTRKFPRFFCLGEKEDFSDELKELITSDEEYNKLADHYFQIKQAHRCLVIQPYVKWGRNKLNITPDEQLSEAIALINTLPAWTVEDTLAVPLDTLDRKALLKSGSMEKIRNLVQKNSNFSAIFINSGSLKKVTINILQENFQRPIFDRYNIVMQILKAHATSKHAKLQVALAELYYVRRKSEKDLFFRTYDPETLRLMFQEREQKLKIEIKNIRNQRNILRNKRQKMDYPVVAVVGYTNAGKTSIIKSLTGEESLKPKNQLFATLDVTVHKGTLPSGLEVLYIDTVGFISDIPTNLIECFVATLEDALLADVILHVEDISSKSYEYKRNHVFQTLERLQIQAESKNVLGKVIGIGNKCDLVVDQIDQKADVLLVSAEKGQGLEELKHQLESFILHITGRKKITIRTSNGGDGIRWLYRNATVLEEIPDQDNLQYVFVRVIITAANLDKFKHHFI
ncbi:unnamed protein product [Ceutorhynchus assimilis]|uniref:Hflx-type G domain-containing protein n=1 Tax=Ceutorhynchus assimilis TaxID=467358 RepID=A0A9N9MP70_9CUCU|nr:unnamed protein product [Ceutorhynchus assimilis]